MLAACKALASRQSALILPRGPKNSLGDTSGTLPAALPYAHLSLRRRASNLQISNVFDQFLRLVRRAAETSRRSCSRFARCSKISTRTSPTNSRRSWIRTTSAIRSSLRSRIRRAGGGRRKRRASGMQKCLRISREVSGKRERAARRLSRPMTSL